MDFADLVRARYSVRSYQKTSVEEKKLELILEAARLAPTAANRQPFQLIVIETAGREQDLRQIYDKDWFVEAPLVLCACGIPEQGWVRNNYDGMNYTIVDTAIVVDHITLQAADLGLGTCWVGAFDPQAARELLKLPDRAEPIAFTPLGYPADQAKEKVRKPLENLVRYQSWS